MGAAQVSPLFLCCGGGSVCLIAAEIICRYESRPGGRWFLLAVCVSRLSSSSQADASQLFRHLGEQLCPTEPSEALAAQGSILLLLLCQWEKFPRGHDFVVPTFICRMRNFAAFSPPEPHSVGS